MNFFFEFFFDIILFDLGFDVGESRNLQIAWPYRPFPLSHQAMVGDLGQCQPQIPTIPMSSKPHYRLIFDLHQVKRHFLTEILSKIYPWRPQQYP
jgi:hypothetical protein